MEGENPPVAQLGAGGAPTEVDTAVANLVVPQIPNGACLQLDVYKRQVDSLAAPMSMLNALILAVANKKGADISATFSELEHIW